MAHKFEIEILGITENSNHELEVYSRLFRSTNEKIYLALSPQDDPDKLYWVDVDPKWGPSTYWCLQRGEINLDTHKVIAHIQGENVVSITVEKRYKPARKEPRELDPIYLQLTNYGIF